jgi:hypothetical protein
MKPTHAAVAILLVTGAPAPAHRLDEYLQGVILSVERSRVEAEITLTPGVAVFAGLISYIDLNSDGSLSEPEQSAYAGQVLQDLALAIDGHPLPLHLLSLQFPSIAEMKEGRGEIVIRFDANLPAGGSDRQLTFENHHQSRIAAYQVNCLVPRDPHIRILAQKRNYSQSRYELDFTHEGARSNSLILASIAGIGKPLGTAALLLFAWLALLVGLRAKPSQRTSPELPWTINGQSSAPASPGSEPLLP